MNISRIIQQMIYLLNLGFLEIKKIYHLSDCPGYQWNYY